MEGKKDIFTNDFNVLIKKIRRKKTLFIEGISFILLSLFFFFYTGKVKDHCLKEKENRLKMETLTSKRNQDGRRKFPTPSRSCISRRLTSQSFCAQIKFSRNMRECDNSISIQHRANTDN